MQLVMPRGFSIDPPLRPLLLCQSLTMLAMMVGQVALPWWIAEAGGAQQLAWYGALTSLFAIASMPALSPLADRWPKRLLLAAGLALFALAALLLLLLHQLLGYRQEGVLACGLLLVLANSLAMPAMLSLAAELVLAERLPSALGQQKAAQALGQILGPLLGGLVLASRGVAATLGFYLLALLAALLGALRIAPVPQSAPASASPGWWAELRAGLAIKWQVRLDRWWTLAHGLLMVFLLPAIGLLMPLRVQSLGWSASWLGVCQAALALGLLLGAILLVPALVRACGRWCALLLALVLCGLALLGLAWCQQPWSLIACYGVAGATLAAVQLIGQSHRLLAMPAAVRGRSTAIHIMVLQLAGSIGPALAGLLLGWLSAADIYLICGLGVWLSACLLARLPGLRAFLALDASSLGDWYLHRYPQAFGRIRQQPDGAALNS